MSYKAIKRYINSSNGRIKENILSKDAEALPSRHRTIKSFKESFGGINHYTCTLKDYCIVINIKYAFNHFQDNTYSENRAHLNATLLPTLQDPLIVIKSKYKMKNSLTYYKPFKNQHGLHHMVMFQAHQDTDGKYYFKTIYKVEGLHKVSEIIKATDGNTIYFKYD